MIEKKDADDLLKVLNHYSVYAPEDGLSPKRIDQLEDLLIDFAVGEKTSTSGE